MQAAKAQKLILGLDAPQKRRLGQYCSLLKTNRDPKYFDKRVYTELLNYASDKDRIIRAKSYLDKLGFTQSRYAYSLIDESISKFQQPDHPSFQWNKNYNLAKELLKKEFRKLNLSTIKYQSEQDIVENLPRVDTHAGFSFILTGLKKKGDYVGDLFLNYRKELASAKLEGSFNKPILIGSRTQASGAFDDLTNETTNVFKAKTRLVSMIDIYQIIAELTFAKPVQQALSLTLWYAGGKADQEIHNQVYCAATQARTVLSLDYSSYDQTISSWLIDDAFEIVREAFATQTDFDDQLFNIIKYDFKNKAFIDGDSKIRFARKGVPSGSMFTQIIDSVVNRLMITTYMISKNITLYQMMIMGDDNLLMVRQDVITKEEIASYITKNFGVTCNPDKCKEYSYPSQFEFLSRYWRCDGIWRSPEILISKMLYPERYRNYVANKDMSPLAIIYSYYLSFYLGMQEILDWQLMKSEVVSLKDDSKERAKFVSGLERYRLLYLT